nr:IS630 transposase-related protein [Holospora curviuscula]
MVRYKPARKIDMERLEHDIKMYPNAYQRERAERFGVSAVGILKALRRLGESYKKTLNHPKKDPEKRSVLCQTCDELKSKGNRVLPLMNLESRIICQELTGIL